MQSIILGIVEGVTEFLPISSTFHLIVASRWLGLPQSDSQKLFEVVIQAGAILAVIFLYLRTLLLDHELLKKVIVSFVPTAVIGLVLYKLIKGFFFENYLLQLTVFAAVGIIFIVFEKTRRGHYLRTGSDLSYTEALLVGAAQALSVIPGVSRAGAAMVALMYVNTRRDEAAKYSFLLAVPTVIGAAALDLFKSRALLLTATYEWTPLVIGALAAFATSLLVIKWFIRYLQTHTISIFGWYRIIAALTLIALSYFFPV